MCVIEPIPRSCCIHRKLHTPTSPPFQAQPAPKRGGPLFVADGTIPPASSAASCRSPPRLAAAGAAAHQELEQWQCLWCCAFYPLAVAVPHSAACEHLPQRLAGKSVPLCIEGDVRQQLGARLTTSQSRALDHVCRVAAAASAAALPALQARALTMGFNVSEFESVLRFVRDVAPLIIHVSTEVLGLLLNDTHYRRVLLPAPSLSCSLRVGLVVTALRNSRRVRPPTTCVGFTRLPQPPLGRRNQFEV